MRRGRFIVTGLAFAMLGVAAYSTAPYGESPSAVSPAIMPRIGTVDERFQSYNIEMVEVIGGRFWKPYGSTTNKSKAQEPATQEGSTPAGIDPNLYQYRKPIDLSNPRLRKLAAALGPAYVRVSGTWANTTYFAESDQPPATPPRGFGAILSQQQWKGVIEFAKAVNADIVTSFATGTGTRDARGIWRPDDARRWVDYTRSAGGGTARVGVQDEPTIGSIGRG